MWCFRKWGFRASRRSKQYDNMAVYNRRSTYYWLALVRCRTRLQSHREIPPQFDFFDCLISDTFRGKKTYDVLVRLDQLV